MSCYDWNSDGRYVCLDNLYITCWVLLACFFLLILSKFTFSLSFFFKGVNVRFYLSEDINTLILHYWCEKVKILSLCRHYILYIIT